MKLIFVHPKKPSSKEIALSSAFVSCNFKEVIIGLLVICKMKLIILFSMNFLKFKRFSDFNLSKIKLKSLTI